MIPWERSLLFKLFLTSLLCSSILCAAYVPYVSLRQSLEVKSIDVRRSESAKQRPLIPKVYSQTYFFFVNILCLNKPPIYQNPERFLHTALFCSFSAPPTVKSALHKEGTAVIWRFIGFFPGEIGAILCLSL